MNVNKHDSNSRDVTRDKRELGCFFGLGKNKNVNKIYPESIVVRKNGACMAY